MERTSEVFRFVNHKKSRFLFGTYRIEKNQLDWIIGKNPMRFEKMYNIRYNENLFEMRNGGVLSDSLPDYIILYNHKNPSEGCHLFPCVSSSKKSEEEMKVLQYPQPQGNYIVYLLGDEIVTEYVDIEPLLQTISDNCNSIPNMPVVLTGDSVLPYVNHQKYVQPFQQEGKDKVLRFIDLFAGIGGIRMGFENVFGENGKTVFVSEWDIPAQKTYKANFKDNFEIAGDITVIKEESIPKFDICLAGFPCQAFSMAGKHQGFKDDYKGRCRGTLFLDVARICDYHKPKVIFCENVKGLTIHDKGKTFKIIKETFENLGYKVFAKILNSKDFGVPQQRERIYIVCFRNDIAPKSFVFPEGSKTSVCIRDIMDDAPIPSKYYLSDTYVNTLKAHRARHEAAGHGFGYVIRPLDGLSGTIVCGGMGRETNLIIDQREHSLVPTTHIKGKINEEGIRKMTPREWARLQGFPDNFILPLSDVHLYKQFGNSVTVPVIEAIAKQIYKVLNN